MVWNKKYKIMPKHDLQNKQRTKQKICKFNKNMSNIDTTYNF